MASAEADAVIAPFVGLGAAGLDAVRGGAAVMAAWLPEQELDPVLGAASRWSETALVGALDAIGVSRAALDRLEVELVREGMARGLHTEQGHSAADWMCVVEGVHAPPPDRTHASRVVAMATAANAAAASNDSSLVDTVVSAVGEGRLSVVKGAQIVRFLDDVVPVADGQELSEVVSTMVAAAVDAPEAPLRAAAPGESWLGSWGLTSRELATVINKTRQVLKPNDLLAEEEAAARRGRALHTLPGPGGLTEYRLTVEAEAAAVIDAAVAALSSPVPGPNGEPDPRRAAHRRADALMDVITRGVEAGGKVPRWSRAQLLVTIDLDSLRGVTDTAGVTGTGQVSSAATVRRTACDAGIIPMVLGTAGRALDVGREKRLFTEAQRLAVWRRDTHCTFPGCTVRASWCDLHHLIAWATGGRTDLTNCALLCQRHHTLVHEQELTAAVTAMGVRWNLRP
ncbi:HNH endonuclease signature motif containing protein [Branchiibius hedensis]|uniref:HNH endonuclease signature motif containing protein n=1 Tax=Branchiibius hedensis TaxID=672460 RepID=UPI000D6A8843|nr:HNH endonuclease signature motif containing protein [Branchiibius hedensis]